MSLPVEGPLVDAQDLSRILYGQQLGGLWLRRLLDEDRESTDLPRRERRNKVTQLRP
jgi:hypothetical protein